MIVFFNCMKYVKIYFMKNKKEPTFSSTEVQMSPPIDKCMN